MKKTASLRGAAAQVVSNHDYENGFDLSEVWSDAARKASAAARAAKKKGGDWRKAGRREYFDATRSNDSPGHHAARIKPGYVDRGKHPFKSSIKRWDALADAGNAGTVAGAGKTPGEAGYAARRDAAKQAKKVRAFGSTGRSMAKKLIQAGHSFSRPKRDKKAKAGSDGVDRGMVGGMVIRPMRTRLPGSRVGGWKAF